jgi:hypothetical protein
MNNKKLFTLFLILLVIILSIPACNSEKNTTDNTEEGNSNQDESSKLDFNIKRLIEAEQRGELEEFAEPRDIELIDGSVTVTIECKSGQADAVAEAAAALGNVELIVHYLDLVQVVAPITNLTALADIPGVILVRLPIYAEEEGEE